MPASAAANADVSQEPAATYTRGVKAFEAHDWQTARTAFEQAVRIAPVQLEPPLALAMVLMKLNEVEAAAASVDDCFSRIDFLSGRMSPEDNSRTERILCESLSQLVARLPPITRAKVTNLCNTNEAMQAEAVAAEVAKAKATRVAHGAAAMPESDKPGELEEHAPPPPFTFSTRPCVTTDSSAARSCLAEATSLPVPETEAAAPSHSSSSWASEGGGVCVCASLHAGSTAQLDDWLVQQRCGGGRAAGVAARALHVVLHDARDLSALEATAATWALRPWIDDGFVTRHEAPPGARNDAGAEDDAGKRASASAGPAWARTGARGYTMLVSAPSEASAALRRPPSEEMAAACRAALARQTGTPCSWMVALEAPYEQLHWARIDGDAQQDGEGESASTCDAVAAAEPAIAEPAASEPAVAAPAAAASARGLSALLSRLLTSAEEVRLSVVPI